MQIIICGRFYIIKKGGAIMEYTIKNDQLTVTLKTLSGTLKSVRDNEGHEYIWQADPAVWSGQAPVCFPICGSIRNNTATIGNGKTTNMPRHGIVKKKEFTMENQTRDSIKFSLTSDAETMEQYPFPFKLYTIYRLEGKSLHVTYRVKNTGTETMPFFIGGHPGFSCPIEEGEAFEDYHLIFPEKETCAPSTPLKNGLQDTNVRTPLLDDTNDLPLSYDYFMHDLRDLDTLKSRSVKMVSSRTGKGIQLDFADFPYLMLWTKPGAKFLAIEPWTGMSTTTNEDDIFEHKVNVQSAEPGESKDYTFTITVLN